MILSASVTGGARPLVARAHAPVCPSLATPMALYGSSLGVCPLFVLNPKFTDILVMKLYALCMVQNNLIQQFWQIYPLYWHCSAFKCPSSPIVLRVNVHCVLYLTVYFCTLHNTLVPTHPMLASTPAMTVYMCESKESQYDMTTKAATERHTCPPGGCG